MKYLAGTKGLLWVLRLQEPESKTVLRALLLSCATHINRHVSR